MKLARDGVGACRQAAVAFCMVAIGLPLPLMAQQIQEGQQEEASYASLDFPMAEAMNNWGVSTQEELDSLFGDYFPGGGIIFVPDGPSRQMILIDPSAPLDEGFFPEDSPLTEQEKALEYFRQNAVAESSFYVIESGSESQTEGITLTIVAGIWASEKYVMGVELSFGADFGIFMPLQIEDEYALAAASMEEVAFPVLEKESDGVPFDIPGDGSPPERRVSFGGAGGGNVGGALCAAAATACRATARADHATKYHACCANYWTLVVACSVAGGAAIAIPILGPWIGIIGGIGCILGAAALLVQCINAERMVLRAKLMTCRVRNTECCMKPGIVCNPINY